MQLFKAYALSVLFKQYLCESICCLDSQLLLTLKCAVFSIDYLLLGCCSMWSIKIVALKKCGYCFPSLPTCHWGCILVRHIIIGSFAQLWSPWLCSPTNRCKWLLILKLHTCNVSPKFASLIYSLLCTLCSAGTEWSFPALLWSLFLALCILSKEHCNMCHS